MKISSPQGKTASEQLNVLQIDLYKAEERLKIEYYFEYFLYSDSNKKVISITAYYYKGINSDVLKKEQRHKTYYIKL